MLSILRLIPKNLASYLTGCLARCPLPPLVRDVACRIFVSIFGIDLDEAEEATYHSIEDVFTRRLKPGVRPIQAAVCSPADGTLVQARRVDGDRAIQVKGKGYSLSELVLGETTEQLWQSGWYTTVYLAPHNYHRVHSPVAGTLDRLRYLPGELWPVNEGAVRGVPRLFNRNERMVFEITLEGGGRVAVAMVGAFNVGRIATPFSSLVANDRPRFGWAQSRTEEVGASIAAGDELGVFMLGSTVVCVFDPKAADSFNLMQTQQSQRILMGQSLVVE